MRHIIKNTISGLFEKKRGREGASRKQNLRYYPVSLYTALILAFSVVFIIAFGSLYFIFKSHNQNVFTFMSNRLLTSKSETIENVIKYQLDLPRQANSFVVHALSKKETITTDDAKKELLYVTETVFPQRDYLSSIAYGGTAGDYVGISRDKRSHNQRYLIEKSASTHNVLTFYKGITENSDVTKVEPHYSVENRPWYRVVASGKSEAWIPMYMAQNYQDNSLTISYSTPVYNHRGQFSGVVSSDLSVVALNALLRQIKPFSDSLLFVVNPDKQIIAASDDQYLLGGARRVLEGKSQIPYLGEIDTPEIRAINRLFSAGKQTRLGSFTVDGSMYYMLAFPVQSSEHDVKLSGIVVVSERILLSEIARYQKIFIAETALLFVSGMIVVFFVVSKITTSLKNIAKKTSLLDTNRWEFDPEVRQFPEIMTLELSFLALSDKLNAAFYALRQKIEKDPVTGIFTREGLLNEVSLYDGRNVLSQVQIRNYSNVVNALGSEFADRFITLFIARVRQLLPPGTLLCRDTSNTVIIVPPGFLKAEEVAGYNKKLLCLFYHDDANLMVGGDNSVFNGNVGTVYNTIDRSNVHAVIQNAGIALNFSKMQGGGTFSCFENAMLQKELRNIQVHDNMTRAMINGEFSLVIQPIVELNNPGESCEGECLVRWHSDVMGWVSPGEFIPLAEETGLIVYLGQWVIQQACFELSSMMKAGLSPDFKLHINVSAIQLVQANFSQHLLDTIAQYELVNANICIEITESQLLQEVESVVSALHYLRQCGVSVALDDFGTGFSSLSYLHKLPFDCIKIDRDFIKDILRDSNNMSVVASVLFLAARFHVPVVAEGVEDLQTEDMLRQLGCQKVQGYFYSKPVPFDKINIAGGKISVIAPSESILR